MTIKKDNISGKAGLRELWGLALLTISVLTVLAIVSYQGNDISLIKMPPNAPPLNYIGPVGAWYVFFSFMVFGLSTLVCPAVCAGLGLLLLLRQNEPIKPWLIWGLAALFSASALFTINSPVWEKLAARFNILGFSGGLLGWLLGDQFLSTLFGSTGATVILIALLITAFVMCFGLTRLRTLVIRMGDFFVMIRKKISAMIDARRNRFEKIVIEEREIAKKRALIEKALRREKVVLPKEPVIIESEVVIAPERTVSVPEKKPAPSPEKPVKETTPTGEARTTVVQNKKNLPEKENKYQLPTLDLDRKS